MKQLRRVREKDYRKIDGKIDRRDQKCVTASSDRQREFGGEINRTRTVQTDRAVSVPAVGINSCLDIGRRWFDIVFAGAAEDRQVFRQIADRGAERAGIAVPMGQVDFSLHVQDIALSL